MPDIKESLEIFDAVDALSAALAAAKKDGEVNWLDLPKFVPVIAKARTAADGSEKIKDELKDLDNAEMKQLLERACTSVSGLVAAILKKDEKAS